MLHPEQLVKGLCFGFADLIVGVVQRENDAEVELFAHPLEIRVFIGQQLAQHGRQQTVIFLQRFDDAAGRQVQLGQTPAVVFHLLDELQRWLTAGQNSGGRARSKRSQSSADLGFVLPRLELPALQFQEELPVERFGVGQQEYGEPLQVHT